MILAGAIDETFSARFVASIATFNRSMAPSRPSGCWDPAFMVETGGGAREPWGVKAVTKGRGALHKQAWHVAKRIVFAAVALKRGARGRSVAHNIYLLPTSRPRHPQLWKDASFSDRQHNAVHLLWLPRPTPDTQARSRNTFITYYPPSLPHLQPQTSVDPPRPFES